MADGRQSPPAIQVDMLGLAGAIGETAPTRVNETTGKGLRAPLCSILEAAGSPPDDGLDRSHAECRRARLACCFYSGVDHLLVDRRELIAISQMLLAAADAIRAMASSPAAAEGPARRNIGTWPCQGGLVINRPPADFRSFGTERPLRHRANGSGPQS